MAQSKRNRRFFRLGPFVRTAGVLYGGGALAGTLLIGVFLRRPGIVWPGLGQALEGVGIGLAALIPVEILSLWLFRYRPRTRELGAELRTIMGPIGTVGIGLLAVGSGVGEEIIFRGLVQTALSGWVGVPFGIVFASLIFGAMHIPPKRELAGWMVFAALIGVYLGLLYAWTGNIVAPAVTHALVNFINLHVIAQIRPLSSWFLGAHAEPEGAR